MKESQKENDQKRYKEASDACIEIDPLRFCCLAAGFSSAAGIDPKGRRAAGSALSEGMQIKSAVPATIAYAALAAAYAGLIVLLSRL